MLFRPSQTKSKKPVKMIKNNNKITRRNQGHDDSNRRILVNLWGKKINKKENDIMTSQICI